MEMIEKAKALKEASLTLGCTETLQRNQGLQKVKESLGKNRAFILVENEKDIEVAKKQGMKESLIDRLRLTEARMIEIENSLDIVIQSKDPLWNSNQVWTLENGLNISKMTVPIGVIGIVYESRPNVTVDAFALALKSGNCILLRGSSSAIHSNKAIVKAIKEGLDKSEISSQIIALIEDTARENVIQMVQLTDYLDLVIPRGGAGLIETVVKNATVPTIETGTGNCHVYVDEWAKQEDAIRIVVNAKTQRTGVCNACETLLVHETIAEKFLIELEHHFKDRVKIKGCPKTLTYISGEPATEWDWANEFLDMILAVKVVDNLDEAIAHINHYGTKHSESIVTENYTYANRFLKEVDAAAVYVNASTRFTDGGVFGFGCEMGISTQKIHARGPMGLNELVTTKYVIRGNGQIR